MSVKDFLFQFFNLQTLFLFYSLKSSIECIEYTIYDVATRVLIFTNLFFSFAFHMTGHNSSNSLPFTYKNTLTATVTGFTIPSQAITHRKIDQPITIEGTVL